MKNFDSLMKKNIQTCITGIFSVSVLFLIAVVSPAMAQASQAILIKDAKVHTLTGEGFGNVIEEGDVLINNGVIAAVGGDIPAPAGARVIDATGKVVTPGFFAPWSQLGLVEIGLDAEANDGSPSAPFALSASLNALDGFNPDSSLIPINRAGGVTRALVAPTPGASDKMFGGQAIVVSLSGRVDSITRQSAAQFVTMGYSGAARSGGDTRLGAWAVLREYLDEAERYAANPRDYVNRPRDERLSLRDLEALRPVVNGDQPLVVSINRASEIRTLVKLKTDHDLKVIILGGSEAWKVARELALEDIPVIMNPMANLPYRFEDLGSTLANAARLHAAGVEVSFYSNGAGGGSHNLRLLPFYAGNAVANDLPYAAALAGLTIIPAQMFGLASRLGSLQTGKIADVVIWDGDPLEVTTRPEAVFIDGRETSLENRQTALRERYKSLERGDLPFAYRGRN